MDLKSMMQSLETMTDKEKIVKVLQESVKYLLTDYQLTVCGITFYPLEAECYLYRAGVFEDSYVHDNELQCNHYGEFYVHRTVRTAEKKYKMDNRVCLGVCLSPSDSFYYSTLIRSAVFDDGEKVFGPNNVLTALVRRINEQTHLIAPAFFTSSRHGSFEMSKVFPLIEGCTILFPINSEVDPRGASEVMFSSRVGLGDSNPYFRQLLLRAVTGGLGKEYAYKDKTTILLNVLKSKQLKGEQAAVEARKLFGSAPRKVLEALENS